MAIVEDDRVSISRFVVVVGLASGSSMERVWRNRSWTRLVLMESMARSISTHSLRIAFGSRGADAGGLTRLCISTSPV